MTVTLKSREIQKLVELASESARQDLSKESRYIDFDNNVASLAVKRHTVVFGRRGSGKTTLLKQLRNSKKGDSEVIWVDSDVYKNLTFPDTLIEVFRSLVDELQKLLKKNAPWWSAVVGCNHKLVKRLAKQSKFLNDLKTRFDHAVVTVTNESSSMTADKGDVGIAAGSIRAGVGSAQSEASRTVRTAAGPQAKVGEIDRSLKDLKDLVSDTVRVINKVVFVVMDDFYHLRVNDQAQVLDYMSRLLKNTNCYLKVSTITHRSRLYRAGETLDGLQLGHDANDINLDRSFKNFQSVDNFLTQFWQELYKNVGSGDEATALFAGDSWHQLVLASGGVPRDLMNIFTKAVEVGNLKGKDKFDKTLISEAASLYFRESKQQDLVHDAGHDTSMPDKLLKDLISFCVKEKKKNVFLIWTDDLDAHANALEWLRQLCDFRLIHEVHENTSSSFESGKRFRAYLLDVGIYAYPPRRKSNRVEEVEFWEKDEKHRMTALQNSPIYKLKKDYASVEGGGFELVKTLAAEDENIDSSQSAVSRKDKPSEQTLLDI